MEMDIQQDNNIKQITIIGNGESRKPIDLNLVRGVKIGCNGIYLHDNVDMVCAMDKFWRDKIEKETDIPLISRKNNMLIQNVLQVRYKNKWYDTHVKYQGYCSGCTALDYICANSVPKTCNIFLLGFDFDYTGTFVNHMYKDTPNHPNSNRPAQSENLFLQETLQIARRYPLHNIVWVNDNSNFVIKINRITLQQYKNLVY